jgi:hypothetical protein
LASSPISCESCAMESGSGHLYASAPGPKMCFASVWVCLIETGSFVARKL